MRGPGRAQRSTQVRGPESLGAVIDEQLLKREPTHELSYGSEALAEYVNLSDDWFAAPLSLDNRLVVGRITSVSCPKIPRVAESGLRVFVSLAQRVLNSRILHSVQE